MKSIFCVLFFTTSCFLQAQPPSKFYTRVGGAGYDVGYDVKQTLDNGYVITGSTSSYGLGNTDMYFLKLDSVGQIRIQTTFGNVNNDVGKSIIQLIDSSYVMVGYTNSLGFGGYDVFLVKVDKNGILLWQKTIGGTNWDFANCIQQTTDGGFIIAGSTFSYGYGNSDGYVIKTDASGNVTWSKFFGGIKDDEFKSVIQTVDGGYALTGNTKSYGDINGDAWVFKLLANGDSSWSKQYGGSKEDFGNKVYQLQNLELVVVGGTKSVSTNSVIETMVVKYDPIIGTQYISYVNSGTKDEYYNSFAEGLNGKLAACGKSTSAIFGIQGIVHIYTNFFNYFNFFPFAAGTNDELFSIYKTKDKGFVCVGVTQSLTSLLQDVIILKMDSTGAYANNITSVQNNLDINSDFTFFPNPASHIINIRMNNALKLSQPNYKIIDIEGNIIKKDFIISNDWQIEIQNLANGLYFLQLFDSSNLLKTSKISILK